MNLETDNRPDCFGLLELVFPKGEDGLRHSPETCMACALKTDCLRSAIARTGGIEVEEEKVDRAYESGTIRFFERWSRKKSLYYRRKNLSEDKNRETKS